MTDQTSQDAILQQSQEIQRAYEALADTVSEAEATARTLSAEEAKFAASQFVMMWRRFRRNTPAVISAFALRNFTSIPAVLREAARVLVPGGLLLAHNIDSNSAFADFAEKAERQAFQLANLGGIRK